MPAEEHESTLPERGAAADEEASAEPLHAWNETMRERVKSRIRDDGAFGQALFSEAVEVLLANDLATAKSVFFDYIEATLGFDELAALSGLAADTLKDMFGPAGDPRAADLFKVLGLLQRHQGIRLEVNTAA